MSRVPKRLAPGSWLCGYQIERELGRGAMGAVFAARDAKGSAAALKTLIGRRSPERRERFRRELELARELDHPGIVRVLGGDAMGETPCLVLELVDGRELGEVFREVDLGTRLELLEQVCAAVQHAHDRGVVHRDLKPANVLVTRGGEAKVTDFGLARDLDRETRLTKTGVLMGTPFYMAPEQVIGDKASGEAADVYALGVMLYEAITGELPYQADTAIELCNQIVGVAPPRPSKRSAEAGAAHDRVCRQAMAKSAEARHPSAAALGAEIHCLRTGQPLPGGSSRAKRLLLALTGVATLVFAALAGLLLTRQRAVSPPAEVHDEAPEQDPVREPNVASVGTAARAAPSRPRIHPQVYYDELERAEALLRFETFVPEQFEEAKGWNRDGMEAAANAIKAARTPRASFVNALGALTAFEPKLGMRLLDRVEEELLDPKTRDDELLYETYLLRAVFEQVSGDRDRARSSLDRAVRLLPDRFEAYERRGRLAVESAPRAAVLDLEQAYALAPGPSATTLAAGLWFAAKDRAPGARRAARLGRARRVVDEALAADPNDGQAYTIRAWLRRDAGDESGAESDSRAALAAFARHTGLVGYYALRVREYRIAVEGGARGTVLAFVTTALEFMDVLAPWHAEAAAERGILTFARGKDEESCATAWRQLVRARELNPLNWEAAYYRGLVMASRWTEMSLPRAVPELTLALQERPDHVGALLARARAYMGLGRAKKAEADARRVTELAPSTSGGWNVLRGALRYQGRDAEADRLKGPG